MKERLARFVGEFPQCRVVVVGDAIADQFVYGEISRVSREAPVLILRHERTETVPGGAANCAANLAALGAHAALVCVVGADEPGRALLAKLNALGVDCRGALSAHDGATVTKARIFAGQAHAPRQQVIRIDYEGTARAADELKTQLTERVTTAVADADAVIISDYNYGVASAEVVAAVRAATSERGVPVLVDSRFRMPDFAGFTSATPNEDEVEHLLGRKLDAATLAAAATELCARLDYRALLVTRGPEGMLLVEPGRAPVSIAAVGAREAVDVTGAGDTVIAAYTLALARGADFSAAAHLANHAGGLVVMKRGTATVTAEELIEAVSD
jgi:rfaE bifunctional protein kinase chain/domain